MGSNVTGGRVGSYVTGGSVGSNAIGGLGMFVGLVILLREEIVGDSVVVSVAGKDGCMEGTEVVSAGTIGSTTSSLSEGSMLFLEPPPTDTPTAMAIINTIIMHAINAIFRRFFHQGTGCSLSGSGSSISDNSSFVLSLSSVISIS